MELRITEEMRNQFDELGYDKIIKKTIGFDFKILMFEFSNIDDMTCEQLRRHIERLNNDQTRFSNQLLKKFNEDLYLFNNCHNLQKYINNLRAVMETSDLKFLYKYYISSYKDLIDLVTFEFEIQKKDILEKQKEHMKAHASEELICECGARISRKHISRHKMTKKHIEFVTIYPAVLVV